MERKWWTLIAVSVAIAVIAGGSGVLFSYQWDLPTGPTIVAALTAILAFCGVVKGVTRFG